jgi:hypothetical protein
MIPMSLIEKASETPLCSELMKRMAKCIDAMPAEHRGDATARSLALAQFLWAESRDRPEVLARISTLVTFEFRMEALMRLRKGREYRAWAMTSKMPGAPDIIDGPLIEVAAAHPLVERNKRPAFDPATFFRAVLGHAEVAAAHEPNAPIIPARTLSRRVCDGRRD